MITQINVTLFRRQSCWGYVRWYWYAQRSCDIQAGETIEEKITPLLKLAAERAMKRQRTLIEITIHSVNEELENAHKTYSRSTFEIVKDGKGAPVRLVAANRWG